MNERKQFTIKRIDPLGQGVALDDEKVTFIPKTLPGEVVEATILSKKGKNVQFAKLEKVITPSEQRTPSPCPHYTECQGCSFLHTDYQSEVLNKKSAYSFLFKKYKSPEDISYHLAASRFQYRNRIQLHYEIKGRSEKLGFMNQKGIHPISTCLLPNPIIQEKLKRIIEDGSWKHLAPTDAPSGHFELSKKGEEVDLYFNRPYADGGFTQVNQPMAKLARDLIQNKIKALTTQNTLLIDLFGGKGFLTKGLKNSTVVIDFGARPDWKNSKEKFYVDQNLFKKKAIQKLKNSLASFLSKSEERVLILDPPRSGCKNIKEFIDFLKPQYIIYLSCNPSTQVRDIYELCQTKEWEVEDINFFDFFPATHHLESLVFLKRNKP